MHVAQLAAFGFTLPNVRVNVADLGHDIDGLLGMSFLNNFNFEVRLSDRRMLVEKIAP